MPIDIPAAIASINGGIQLARGLVDASSELGKAELKLRIVDLVDQLVDAKDALLTARTEIRRLEEENARLEGAADQISKLVEDQGFKYRRDEQGQPVGQPYCPRCMESENRLISLQYHLSKMEWVRVCPECKNEFLVDKLARDQASARNREEMKSANKIRRPVY